MNYKNLSFVLIPLTVISKSCNSDIQEGEVLFESKNIISIGKNEDGTKISYKKPFSRNDTWAGIDYIYVKESPSEILKMSKKEKK